ncbi:Uncharacterised protein [Yersinia frederiksenii]|nr:Uncharacterised protein [Yersinia frederiksenii]
MLLKMVLELIENSPLGWTLSPVSWITPVTGNPLTF